MTRRQLLGAAAMGATAAAAAPAGAPRVLKNMGSATPGLGARRQAAKDAGEDFDIIEYCHEKGLGAPHTYMGGKYDPGALKSINDKINRYDMRMTVAVRTPRTDDDLPASVKEVQQKDPNMVFQLEMITRDPLKVPIFTEDYWKVYDEDSSVPPRDSAMLVDWVRTHPPKHPQPRISGLPPTQMLALEDELDDRCIDYAWANLPL